MEESHGSFAGTGRGGLEQAEIVIVTGLLAAQEGDACVRGTDLLETYYSAIEVSTSFDVGHK
jgi:hypothetical protein